MHLTTSLAVGLVVLSALAMAANGQSDDTNGSEDPLSLFMPKPEIKHLFREQEKRPPLVVSYTFSVLVLLPILILFGLWLKIGINFSGFQLSLSALVFHSGVALIFGLYICFFVRLNMFQTLQWLGALGVITFLSGHRLLSGLAKTKK